MADKSVEVCIHYLAIAYNHTYICYKGVLFRCVYFWRFHEARECSQKLDTLANIQIYGIKSVEYLFQVGYAERLQIETIAIYETYNAGAVKKIESLNPSGQWEIIWSTQQVRLITSSRIFSPNIQRKKYPTDSIRITVDCSLSASYVEIDAIKITGIRASEIY
ncbi:hypothetical protein FSP39_014503 [Pinctada imbricata]|uniref:Uncharacterized protein n=1 Tax=Pinctada imbricata TaxID=66713 RepID=A0AA88YCR0_PINIB|nr:hypothetical protein FSP39_014503 [Pinctada imbricata]